MSIILDLILIGILVAFIVVAAKKGFMLTLLELVAVVLALFLASQLSTPVAQAAYDGFFEKSLVESVEEQIDENFDIESTAESIDSVITVMPDFMVNFAESCGVDVEEIKDDIKTDKISSENIATELVETVAEPIAVGALTITFYILLACVLIFVLRIVAKWLSKLFKLPILGTANKILGGAFGAIKGVFVVIFICTILQVFFAGGDNEIADAVNGSTVIGLLEEVNPFTKSFF